VSPARAPRDPRDLVRLLLVDPDRGHADGGEAHELARWLAPGDLLVANDAATLPASLRGRSDGEEIEVRLAEPPRRDRALAVLFGEGDWRIPTQHRPPPPALSPGARIDLGPLVAVIEHVSTLSPRLVTLRFLDAQGQVEGDDLLAAIYAVGRPIQYAHLIDDLALWSVQTLYAGLPWAVELPSAGRPLSWRAIAALREAGVRFATLTHAAGLSATGDPVLDAALPLPERYRIPEETVAAVAQTRAEGGRVIAVGTTVVRALEDAFQKNGAVVSGDSVAHLVLGPSHGLRVVDGIVTGMHAPTESHFRLLEAFAPAQSLLAAHAHALATGYLAHEFGDVALLLRGALAHSAPIAA
jgi:S-adenosylmethionine:tRNA ribosyltransferase-isomerase